MESKICTKCGNNKLLSEFYFRKDTNKYRGACIKCEITRVDKYYSENKESKKDYSSKYYHDNRNMCKEKYAQYRKTKNRIEYTKKYNKKYKIENKDKLNLIYKEKIKTNSLFKLKENIRGLISQYFKKKGFSKKSKTAQILGCTFEEFKIHIESQFAPWMSWSNHGRYIVDGENTWQLDHILPISIAKTEEDMVKLNHYSNFQPLKSKDNNLKSNNIMHLHLDKKDEM